MNHSPYSKKPNKRTRTFFLFSQKKVLGKINRKIFLDFFFSNLQKKIIVLVRIFGSTIHYRQLVGKKTISDYLQIQPFLLLEILSETLSFPLVLVDLPYTSIYKIILQCTTTTCRAGLWCTTTKVEF